MVSVENVKLNHNESKVFLCRKDGEFRLSILQSIASKKNYEVIFVKESDEDEFLKKIKKVLIHKKIKPFQKIQKHSRFSKREKEIKFGSSEMQGVSNHLSEKIEKCLSFYTMKMTA